MTAALENLEYGAEEMLIWLSRMADIPEQSEDKRAWQKNIADRTVKSILALRRAVARGQIWTAVQHAFFAGMFSGHSEASPYLYHAERKLRREAPDVARGVKVIESARKGGRKGGRPKEGPSTETLCSEVTALHGKNCMRSWSWACQEVGTRNNLNRSTVMRRTKDVQWRMP